MENQAIKKLKRVMVVMAEHSRELVRSNADLEPSEKGATFFTWPMNKGGEG